MNLDVRLIQVNERLVKHKLLVAVADCLQNCTGHMQVTFNSRHHELPSHSAQCFYRENI